MLDIRDLIDDEKCFEVVRGLRWREGVRCVKCGSEAVVKNGLDDTQPFRQRYLCNCCEARFDDLTDTVLAGHHGPLKDWILCLYFMGLNLSQHQIGEELGLSKDVIHLMAMQLREGIVQKKAEVKLQGEVECDEVYVVAGHKGHPEAVKKAGRKGRRRRLKSARGRGTLEKEKPPVFGIIQRSGEVFIEMLANVQQKTIRPIIQRIVEAGTLIFTDEYDIYSRLTEWGFGHKTVCHAAGEFARDEDGDGKHEVHVNTIEGFWSLLRSWLRPHRGISQEKLPLYLGFFEFVHNAKVRGKALLEGLIQVLVGITPEPR